MSVMNSHRKSNTVIALALVVLGLMAAPGLKAETVTEGFDNITSVSTLPAGWDYSGGASTITMDRDTYKTSRPSVCVAGTNTSNYLITPMLQGDFNFWIRNYTKNYQATITAYACTYSDGELTLGAQLDTRTLSKTSSTPAWEKVTFNSPSATRVALLMERCYFDDFTYTEAEASGDPQLTVTDFPSGSTYNFGGQPVPQGTEKTFTLLNTGGAPLTVSSITVTGDYTITAGGDITSIAPSASAAVTVATPANDTTGELTIVSDDPDSPYTINLSSTYKEPAPVMVLDVTNVAFGKVTEDASREITVANSGDALLTVNIAVTGQDFTVTPASLTVEAGGSENFTVTYSYDAEAYGGHTALVTVTPNVGDPVEITVSAEVEDPFVWREDFEEGEIPAYWSTTGWTVTKSNYGNNGTYMAFAGTSNTSTSADYVLITPRLSATAGQQLRFEVGGGTDAMDVLHVEYSHDMTSWTPVEGSPITSAGVKTFTAPEDGYYYLKFNGKYGSVDNFEGFRLALKEHDISISGENIPAKGNQYALYTASVTVKEMMGKDETAVAVLVIDGEDVVTSEPQPIAANSEYTFLLSFRPQEPMEGVEAKICVNYADDEIVTSPVTLTIAQAPVLSENDDFDLDYGTVPSLLLDYTAVNGWNTISLPFVPDQDNLTAIFGRDYEIYELKEYDAADGSIKFRTPTMLVAGYPYIVKARNVPAGSEGVILEDVRIEALSGRSDANKGVEFFATFTPVQDEVYGIAQENGQLEALKSADTIGAYHGYITLDSSIHTVPMVKFYDSDGILTGIVSIEDLNASQGIVYDLNGYRVMKPTTPGIYIIDGKKTIVR